jgi:hypothetical protein
MSESLPQTSDRETTSVDRWQFFRDVLVFQVKLALDALRDVILVPISIGAALFDLVSSGKRTGRNFYRVFAMGKRTDIWINLFDTYGNPDESPEAADTIVDSLVAQLEALIVDQHDRGGLTATAKVAIDRALDGISKRPPS